MILKIDGVDIMPYIAQKGIKWQRRDINGQNATQTMDGTTHRSRIATKYDLHITCMPLPTEKSKIVLNAINPEYVEIETIDPRLGHVYKTMFVETVPAVYMDTETDLWEGIVFLLKER